MTDEGMPKRINWDDDRREYWDQLAERPRIPFHLNVLLEGMSLKNSRQTNHEKIAEIKPTINPAKTLTTLGHYLKLFQDHLESTETNVIESIGRLCLNED